MSSVSSLTPSSSSTVEPVSFGSLITTFTRTLTSESASLAHTLSGNDSQTVHVSSTDGTSTSMSTASPGASPTSTSPPGSSRLSKGASIGIGVGLAVAALIILAGLLWFFSTHKRKQEDVNDFEIGPNVTDYRKKTTSIDAISSRPPTNQGTLAGVLHARTGSKGSRHSYNAPAIPRISPEISTDPNV
ncbi:uncharacterized protein PV09_08439 [Verruconis gallopava]|uniref:Mid2 domain-containing protein n=1 Tax=Verruconis gallopava TaxID=253628 RepID=A0A0D1ZZR9_9PEZI|nr:uncharacterized protein PV09_08439 [Verruconis gallopava]KIV99912.1 hypothetical protein PV09_08439 [Verruconis gallopava]